MRKLPVAVLSGCLGAGKTTLPGLVLTDRAGLRVAMIVDDMSEVNIDAQPVAGGDAAFVRTDERLVEMTNGCICCTLPEDLLLGIANLAMEGRFDDPRIGKGLQSVGRAADEDDPRTVADLLAEQVEFANVLIPNKTGQVDGETHGASNEQLNPCALKFGTSFGKVEASRLRGTERFDLEIAEQGKGWQRTLRDDRASEVEKYGVNSFVDRSRRPLHPQRLFDRLSQHWNGVRRSKGFSWLGSRLARSLFGPEQAASRDSISVTVVRSWFYRDRNGRDRALRFAPRLPAHR